MPVAGMLPLSPLKCTPQIARLDPELGANVSFQLKEVSSSAKFRFHCLKLASVNMMAAVDKLWATGVSSK